MPAIYLNSTCAENVITCLKDEKLKALLTEETPVYLFGSISYELLTFFDAFSKEKSTWVRDLSCTLENNKDLFFDLAKRYIANAPTEQKDILTAYMLGCTVHRVVCYHTNDFIEAPILSKDIIDRNIHCFQIDNAFCGEKNIPMNLTDSIGKIEKEKLGFIEELYRYVFKEIKKEIIPDGIIISCAQKLNKALTHRKGLLPKYGDEFLYKPASDSSDILNLTHQKWCSLKNAEEINNFSLPELLSYAQRDLLKCMPKYYEAILRGKANESSEFIFRKMK